jgi:hypothetical protein
LGNGVLLFSGGKGKGDDCRSPGAKGTAPRDEDSDDRRMLVKEMMWVGDDSAVENLMLRTRAVKAGAVPVTRKLTV